MSVDEHATSDPVIRHHPQPLPVTWWLRNRRYMLYMARDFSPILPTVWLLWLILEIARLRAGPAGYHPNLGPGFIAFSGVCGAFAILHSVTFLDLSGVILRVRLGRRKLTPQLIRIANFGLWAAASVVIIGLLMLFGTRR